MARELSHRRSVKGFKILDFMTLLLNPIATMMLADAGVEVPPVVSGFRPDLAALRQLISLRA